MELEKMFVNKKRMAVDAKPEFIKLFKSPNMIASKFKLLKINKQDQKEHSITLLLDLENEDMTKLKNIIRKRNTKN